MSGFGDPAPPVAARRHVVHAAHGTLRDDDYAWLRNVDDAQALAYLAEEREHYDASTTRLEGLHDTLALEMLARTVIADVSLPWRRGGQTYLARHTQGEEHPRLFRVDPQTGDERLVLDVNAVTGADHRAALRLLEPSPGGRLIAYGVDRVGDGTVEIRFRDADTGADLPDVLPRAAAGGAWSADAQVFLYPVVDDLLRAERVLAHRLGTSIEDDVVVRSESDPQFALDVRASRDGRWLVITAASPRSSEVALLRADAPHEPVRLVAPRRAGVEYAVEPLTGGWDARSSDRLLLVTNDGAPEFRLLQATSVPEPGGVGDWAGWQPVPRATQPGERLVRADVIGRHVVLTVRGGGEPYLRVLSREPDSDGRLAARELHAALPYGRLQLWRAEDATATSIVVVEDNLVSPPAWVEVDLTTGARSLLKRSTPPGVDTSRYVTERIMARSADGTAVPVTLARLRDLRPGDSRGCLLVAHGADEVPLWPGFEVGVPSLLDRGVVYAVAHVRGGGELGRRWADAGRGRAKRRGLEDYLAVRDALVAAHWASEAGVIGRGREAGGCLVAAAFSRSPGRWRAVLAEAPLTDLIGALSDPKRPGSAAARLEWGDPAEDADDFAELLTWSPYDCPPPGARPPLLVTAAAQDGRVNVGDIAAWVARLRATDESLHSPVLLRVETGPGAHTGPSGLMSGLRYEAELLAWVLDALGLDERLDPFGG